MGLFASRLQRRANRSSFVRPDSSEKLSVKDGGKQEDYEGALRPEARHHQRVFGRISGDVRLNSEYPPVSNEPGSHRYSRICHLHCHGEGQADR